MRVTLGIVLFSGLLSAEQQVLLVLLKGANALGYYTMDGQPVAKVPVGEHPHEMVLSTDGRYAYITDNGVMRIENAGRGGNTVSVVDIAAKKRVDTIGLGRNRRPHGISLDPVTGRLAVTSESPDGLVLLDGLRRRVLKRFETGGNTSHMVAFGPGKSGAEYAYVSNSGSGDISVVQLTTGELKLLPAGRRPEGSVLSRDGKLLYVCNRESDTITVIDTERRGVVGEIKTGRGPVRIAATPDGRMLIYACMHGHYIEFTDLEVRRPVARIPVKGDPISLNISPDGKLAFASAEELDTVYVISVPDRKLIKTFQVEKGFGPDPVMVATIP